jgi:hypothetical protein
MKFQERVEWPRFNVESILDKKWSIYKKRIFSILMKHLTRPLNVPKN